MVRNAFKCTALMILTSGCATHRLSSVSKTTGGSVGTDCPRRHCDKSPRPSSSRVIPTRRAPSASRTMSKMTNFVSCHALTVPLNSNRLDEMYTENLLFAAYHSKCIDPWLTKSRRVCPVCKRKVFARDERIMSDTDSDTDDERAPLVTRSPAFSAGSAGGTFARQRVHKIGNALLAYFDYKKRAYYLFVPYHFQL
jgi:hypothetical protein